VLTTLTVAGAGYLVRLGVGMLRSTGPSVTAGADVGGRSGWHQAAVGLGISGLNPKVFLLFLALLPQFVQAHAPWPVPIQMVALGLVHVASCALVYTIVGTAARTVLSSRPGAARVVVRVSGAAMVVIGLVLVLEQVVAVV
jgi:threonine/homoserine/homoserine lactone efflux protein